MDYQCPVTGGPTIAAMADANDGSAITVEVWHNKLTLLLSFLILVTSHTLLLISFFNSSHSSTSNPGQTGSTSDY